MKALSQTRPTHLVIPGYRIEHEVGRGGVATVYVAIQESLQRKIALKVMSPALTSDPNFTERFIREGLTIAQLAHQGIVTIYDISVSDYNHYIAMEYLPGGSLKERIKKPVRADIALKLIKQVAVALGYAHSKGIIHRDVKPENIMFRSNKQVVLTDFGIAKSNGSNNELTSAGVIVGTPRYISPEQARGHGTDQRSDIYALGVILYEMLTGKPLYDAKESMAILYSHINDPIPEVPSHHKRLQPLLDAMLAKDPKSRIAECGDLVGYIERLLEVGLGDDQTVGNGNTTFTRHDIATVAHIGAKAAPISSYIAKILWGGIGLTALAVILSIGWGLIRTTNVSPSFPATQDSANFVGKQPMIVAPTKIDAQPANIGEINREVSQDTPGEAVPTPSEDGLPADVEENSPELSDDLEEVANGVVRNLLKIAREQMDGNRLSTPEDDNALHSYREILLIDPDNVQAQMGVNEIATIYLELARVDFEQDNYSDALSYVDLGLAAQPEHEALLEYRLEVEKMVAAEAAFRHGDKLYYGDGVAKNINEAINWYQRGSDSGHTKALYALGAAYANGDGVPANQTLALNLLRQAAVGGNQGAQYNLGLGLLFGPDPDPASAARLLRPLAEDKYETAYPVLGWMYRTGTGVNASLIKAVKWGSKGAFTYGPGNYPKPDRIITAWQGALEKVLEDEATAQEEARHADNR